MGPDVSPGVNPALWGPVAWKVLHKSSVVSMQSGGCPSSHVDFVQATLDVLPCAACRDNARLMVCTVVGRDPVQWVICLHNAVNQKLGRGRYESSTRQLRRRYASVDWEQLIILFVEFLVYNYIEAKELEYRAWFRALRRLPVPCRLDWRPRYRYDRMVRWSNNKVAKNKTTLGMQEPKVYTVDDFPDTDSDDEDYTPSQSDSSGSETDESSGSDGDDLGEAEDPASGYVSSQSSSPLSEK